MTSLKLPRSIHLSSPGEDGWRDSDRAFFDVLLDSVASMGDSDDLKVARWSDDDYEYMELTLPEGQNLEIDVNIHGRRVLIRSIRDE